MYFRHSIACHEYFETLNVVLMMIILVQIYKLNGLRKYN